VSPPHWASRVSLFGRGRWKFREALSSLVGGTHHRRRLGALPGTSPRPPRPRRPRALPMLAQSAEEQRAALQSAITYRITAAEGVIEEAEQEAA